MKKIIFIIIVFVFVFSSSIAIANDGLSVNGQKWNKWSQNSKIDFLWGWMKCGVSADNNMLINLSKNDEFAKLQHKAYVNEGVIINGISIRQLINALDSIYTDPRTIYMDIENIMPLVMGRLNSGWTLEQLDKVISFDLRIIKCQDRETALGSVIDECSILRKERNEYMSILRK